MKTRIIKVFKKIGAVIVLVSIIVISVVAYNPASKQEQSTPVVNVRAKSEANHKILTEEMVVKKLKSKSELVSMEQKFDESATDIDRGFFGTRETSLKLEGKYKLGVKTKDIDVRHVSADGTVYLKLPKPSIISLEIPYYNIDFEKESGLLRGKMSKEEEDKFYKDVEKHIRNTVKGDKGIMETANLHNEQAVKNLLIDLAGLKYIVFE